MVRKDRSRRQGGQRKSLRKKSKPVLLIVCEGENTEPQYFKSLINKPDFRRLMNEVSGSRIPMIPKFQ